MDFAEHDMERATDVPLAARDHAPLVVSARSFTDLQKNRSVCSSKARPWLQPEMAARTAFGEYLR